jgi:asparagine synthetase B (glutamine-hydrolysing)
MYLFIMVKFIILLNYVLSYSLKGQVFYTSSDTEVFLRGLILEGPSFQLRCNGMWSFCLWDRKEKKALFGRDRLVKNLYSIISQQK